MSRNTFSPVRIGVVGLGRFGRLHALTLEGIAEAELVGLVPMNARVMPAVMRLHAMSANS